MLVLTRKAGEGIAIGKGITVKVLSIEGDRIKIGIDAPKDMKVLRLELYQEVTTENKKAINVSKDIIDKIFLNNPQ